MSLIKEAISAVLLFNSVSHEDLSNAALPRRSGSATPEVHRIVRPEAEDQQAELRALLARAVELTRGLNEADERLGENLHTAAESTQNLNTAGLAREIGALNASVGKEAENSHAMREIAAVHLIRETVRASENSFRAMGAEYFNHDQLKQIFYANLISAAADVAEERGRVQDAQHLREYLAAPGSDPRQLEELIFRDGATGPVEKAGIQTASRVAAEVAQVGLTPVERLHFIYELLKPTELGCAGICEKQEVKNGKCVYDAQKCKADKYEEAKKSCNSKGRDKETSGGKDSSSECSEASDSGSCSAKEGKECSAGK